MVGADTLLIVPAERLDAARRRPACSSERPRVLGDDTDGPSFLADLPLEEAGPDDDR